MDKPEIEFDEKEHVYKVNGELFTGVTTILGVRNKPFLVAWAAKEVYNFLLDKLPLVQEMPQNEWEKLLLEAKNAHRIKSTKAKDFGSEAHEWIEKHINGQEQELPTKPEVLSAVKAFLNWEKEHDVNWLHSELKVASLTHKFAGTIDGVAMVDGVLTLIDFKTSNQISEEYFLQIAGYMLALEEYVGIVPEKRLILRIPKDGTDFQAYEVKTDLNFDKQTFINLRACHRWNLYAENFKNEKGKIE